MIEQFRKNKKLITHYYIAALLAYILFLFWAISEESADRTILMILAIYLLLFPIVILYTRNYAVHIFLFLLAFITGFYSFYQYSVESHSILNALYFTFKLYLIDLTDVFTNDGSSLLRYPITIEVARWSAALYTISTVFIAMYRLLESSILLVFYQIMGNHYVIFGYNENSLILIEDLRKKNKRVILIADDMSNEAIDYLEDLKVVIIYHRDNRENIYSKSRLSSANNIILLYEDDIDNLNEFMDIQNYFNIQKTGNLDLTVFIHLQEMTSRKLFQDLEGTVINHNRSFNIQLINLYELFVDALFEKHPIYSSTITKEPIHILIIGFGTLGQHIALESAKQSDQPPFVTAIDKYMPKIKQDWERNYPNKQQLSNFSLSTFDIETDHIETIINNQTLPISHIFVCLHEDKLDLLAGIELSSQFPEIPIYLEFSENGIVDKWIESEVSGNRLIYGTGTFKDILTEDNLLSIKKE